MKSPKKKGLLLVLLALPVLAPAQQSEMATVVKRVSRLTVNDISSLRQKSERGDPQAQFMLGLAYDMGAGVRPDPAEAFRWVSSAARSGHLLAENELGSM